MSPDVAIQAPSSVIQSYANDVEYKVFSKANSALQLSPTSFPKLQSNDTRTMDTLPTELHAYICQIGCIDRGASARSLNKVSKYYNQVTKPYLFRNVSATGIPQCLSLLEQLEATPVNMRQIDHLFLSDTPNKSSSISSSPTRLEDNDIRRLIRLITLAAPFLKTFAFVSNSPFSSTALIARIFRTSFPLLQKLTISGFYPFPSSPGRFPSLTTLHLDGNRNPHGLFQMSALEEVCPKLQNLKITGLGAAGAFVVELEEALAGGEIWDESADFMMPIRLPPLLRNIVIQAGPVPVVSGLKDNASTKDQILMKRLEALKTKSSANADGVKLVVMERMRESFSVEELRAVWLSGIPLDY